MQQNWNLKAAMQQPGYPNIRAGQIGLKENRPSFPVIFSRLVLRGKLLHSLLRKTYFLQKKLFLWKNLLILGRDDVMVVCQLWKLLLQGVYF